MTNKIIVGNFRDAFLVTRNSDGTEGRGRELVHCITEIEATAVRRAKGIDVQGSNGSIKPIHIFSFNNYTYGPISMELPSVDDIRMQEKINKKKIALQKMKDAGITDEDIKDAML